MEEEEEEEEGGRILATGALSVTASEERPALTVLESSGAMEVKDSPTT